MVAFDRDEFMRPANAVVEDMQAVLKMYIAVKNVGTVEKSIKCESYPAYNSQ